MMPQVSRRTFLSRSAAALAAAAMLPNRAFPFPLGLPPGIQLYTVNLAIETDAPSTLQRLAAIGYKEVELAGYGSLKTATAFRRELDANGLRCPSAHLNFDLNNLGKTFDDAHTLGCQYATSSVPRRMLQSPDEPLPSGLSSEQRTREIAKRQQALLGPMSRDEVKRLAETLNKVGAAAKATGLTYASHNHGFEFAPIGAETAYDYLLEHTDHSLVKFELDCGWTSIAGKQPVDFLRRYPGRFKMVHLSDYLPLTASWKDTSGVPPGAELGSGFIPYRKIVADLHHQGIEHAFVEQAGPFNRVPQLQAAELDYAYLETFGP